MKRLFLLVIIGIALAGCANDAGTGAGGDADPAAEVVVEYLTAKAAGDEDGVRANLCSAMEADLRREVASFSGVDASLENAACEREGDSNVVTCTGEFVLVYGGQDNVNRIPLTAYEVVEEDGEWKWCGETAAPAE